ncbi:MAG: SIMPL domain-containing protein [Methanobrevibacter sp.]|nr:SIMPL domain-containing protein [Methanobrevibacter sp.]
MSNKIISVKGKGNLKMSPNLTIVDFEIDVKNKDYEEAYKKYKKSLKKLNNIIKSLKFQKEDLKTKYWNAYPTMDYKEKLVGTNRVIREKVKKYKISHSLKLEFDINNETLSNLLSEISKSEFPLDMNIRYGIKDKESVKNQLLEKSMIDAKNKAEIMVQSLGKELGELKEINYNVDNIAIKHFNPFEVGLKNLQFQESVDLSDFQVDDFEPDDIEFKDDVEVIWAIK